MASTLNLIEEELEKLPADLQMLAEELGVKFPDSYAIACYVPAKIARAQEMPKDVGAQQLAEYLRTTWNATYLRDRFGCVYCGLNGLDGATEYAQITVDHLVPLWPAESGVWGSIPETQTFIRANGPENLACACRHCNSAKGNGLFGLSTDMKREKRIDQVRAALGRSSRPHRYVAEVQAVRAFIHTNSATIRG